MIALRNVQGVGPFLEIQLREAGYATVAGLAAADPGNLMAVRGIGPISAQQIIAAASDLIPGTRDESSTPKGTQGAETELSGAKKNKKKKSKYRGVERKSKKAKKKGKKAKKAKAGKKSKKAKNAAPSGKKANKKAKAKNKKKS